MKIGVYLTRQAATEGGSFTYENSLIRELLHDPPSHNFYVFHHNHIFSQQNILSNITLINIEEYEEEFKPVTKSLRRSFFFKLLRRILLWADLLPSGNLPVYDTNNILNLLCRKLNIELFWFLTPDILPLEVPYIITIWDLQHRRQPYFPEISKDVWFVREEYYNYIIRKATYVITGVNAGKKEIQLFYNVHDDRIKLLGHPTPLLQRSNDINYQSLIEDMKVSKPFIYYPAQYWAHKNHIVILHALALLKKKNNFLLDAVFSGSDKGNIKLIQKQAMELGIQDQVKFAGFVSIDQLTALYLNAEMLIYPTFFGPENLPPLEAMSLGCPAIVSDVDGAREQYGDAVMYFETTDEDDLANKIMQLYNDASLKETLIRNGYQRASSWTPKHYLLGMDKLFNEFSKISRTWNG